MTRRCLTPREFLARTQAFTRSRPGIAPRPHLRAAAVGDAVSGRNFWLVTVERIGTGKQQSRRIEAADEAEAGEKVCALIGGPQSHFYRVVRCTVA
jgi:hypothetical protein